MTGIRTLLAQHSPEQIHRMSDDEVIDAVADLLASGLLHVHTQPVRVISAAGSAVPEAPKLVPFPLSERKPREQTIAYPEPTKEDPPTFSSDIDVAAQAATLVAAAAQGAPFCPT